MKYQRFRKLLHLLFALSVTFAAIENITTYLSLSVRADIVEVGPATLLINLFGLEFGILTAFLLSTAFAFLCYYIALRWLPKRENPPSRTTFRLCFVALTGLCFGLFVSAYNDTFALLFGQTPLGLLDPVSRYFFQLIIIMIGVVLALRIEKSLSRT